MAVMSLTSLLSIQFERYISKNQSQWQLDQSIEKLLTFRETLADDLIDEDIEKAAKRLASKEKYSKQVLIFDEEGQEILGREKLSHSRFKSPFYQMLSQEFKQRGIPLDITVDSYLGNTYYIETQPLIFFRPLFSPRFAGTALRLLLLVGLTGIACYLLTKTLTRRIRQLQKATQQLSNGNYHSALTIAPTSGKDELSQLSQDFQHMAQQLAENTQARKQILSDISHELRSPLARLQVALEITKNQHPDAHQQLARIDKESQRMNTLIGHIIHLQQLQMGDQYLPMEKTTVDLNTLMRDIITDAEYEYQHTDKQLRFSPLPQPCNIFGHAENLHSAFENVIRNAYSHTAANTHVEVSLESNNKEITIQIADRGEGVTKEQLENIFQPFTRLDSSRNRKTGGYGLGLSIAKAIIEKHHGKITAKPRPDNKNGLLVEIILPVAKT